MGSVPMLCAAKIKKPPPVIPDGGVFAIVSRQTAQSRTSGFRQALNLLLGGGVRHCISFLPDSACHVAIVRLPTNKKTAYSGGVDDKICQQNAKTPETQGWGCFFAFLVCCTINCILLPSKLLISLMIPSLAGWINMRNGYCVRSCLWDLYEGCRSLTG